MEKLVVAVFDTKERSTIKLTTILQCCDYRRVPHFLITPEGMPEAERRCCIVNARRCQPIPETLTFNVRIEGSPSS